MWGLRDCRMLVWVNTCDGVFHFVYDTSSWLGIPLPRWSLVPSWGWLTVESDEHCGLRLGGSWKVCTQLMGLHRKISTTSIFITCCVLFMFILMSMACICCMYGIIVIFHMDMCIRRYVVCYACLWKFMTIRSGEKCRGFNLQVLKNSGLWRSMCYRGEEVESSKSPK